MDIEKLEKQLIEYTQTRTYNLPIRDENYVYRCVHLSKKIQEVEGGKLELILPITYLYDYNESENGIVNLDNVGKFLKKIDYPDELIPIVKEGIKSRALEYKKDYPIETQIAMDAYALEKCGAIGFIKIFFSAGSQKNALYHKHDPFCEKRIKSNNSNCAFDRVLLFLNELQKTIKTKAALEIYLRKQKRYKKMMKLYVEELNEEYDIMEMGNDTEENEVEIKDSEKLKEVNYIGSIFTPTSTIKQPLLKRR